MKKLLFIEAVQYGTYYDERYEHISRLGYDVTVLFGSGSLKDKKNGINYFSANNRNVVEIVQYAEKLHKIRQFDGICTLAEPSILATSMIAKALNLPFTSTQSSFASRNKFEMRIMHQKFEVNHPKFIGVSELKDLNHWPRDNFPAIVKPAMGAASSFVFKVNDTSELQRYTQIVLDNIATMDVANLEAIGTEESEIGVIIEEFLDGTEHLVEGYVYKGRFHLGSLVDRITVEGATFDDDVHSAPSSLNGNCVDEIINVVQSAVSSQGIKSAPIHAEVRYNNGIPNIVEVAIRPGGGGLNHMAMISYGYDPLKVVAQLAVQEDPSWSYTGSCKTHTVAACIICKEGAVKNISGTENVDKHESVFFLKIIASKGTNISRPPNGNSIIGFIGVTGNTFKDAVENLGTQSKNIKIELEE